MPDVWELDMFGEFFSRWGLRLLINYDCDAPVSHPLSLGSVWHRWGARCRRRVRVSWNRS